MEVVATGAQILAPKDPSLDTSDSSLAGKCHLGWRDFVMLAGLVLTIILIAVALLLQQYPLAAGIGATLFFQGFGAYYVYSYQDYYDLKQRTRELENIVICLRHTNAELRQIISSLEEHEEVFKTENVRLSVNAQLIQEENKHFKSSNDKLTQIQINLEQEVVRLTHLATRNEQDLWERHKELRQLIQDAEVQNAELKENVALLQAKAKTAAEKYEFFQDRVNIVLTNTVVASKKLGEYTGQFPALRHCFEQFQQLLTQQKDHTDDRCESAKSRDEAGAGECSL